MAHRHRPRTTVDWPFRHCVRPDHCTQGAHGNIVRIDVCGCGAIRRTNINQQHVERGQWEPERE
jgi:hypothetical protein